MPATTRPPYDPEIATFLAGNAEQFPASIFPADIEPMRVAMTRFERPLLELLAGRAIEVEEHSAPGPEGAPAIAISIFRPRRAKTPTAGIYHIHGGGMIFGDRYTGAEMLFLNWVDRMGAVVVSVEYRLAPEHPHPAPVEDCYAGLVWMAANAAVLGIDGSRIAIAGGSAGGGLAAGVALMARDRKGPKLAGQLLTYPMIDDRNETVSSHQFIGLGVWDRHSNLTGWNALLGELRGGAGVSPYAAPARATDLSGLPPTYIDAGSAEVFRDEDVSYASRIWAAGGVAELHIWPGACHGFDGFLPQATVSQGAIRARNEWLCRTLGLQAT